MFRRRGKLAIGPRIRGFLWPKGGWRRAASYFLHRVKRLPGSPYSIAAGLACGAAVSFTPFIGLHFFLGALIAWLIGGNLLASAIGTAIGNPWTFPFIWVLIYRVGLWMLGSDVSHALPEGLSMAYIFEEPRAILLPMFLGSLPTGLVVWLTLFWPVRKIVTNYQMIRRRRRERRSVEVGLAPEDVAPEDKE
jgi:uncharacterized protein (DUF2062 family)